ncbi:hypothetical protein Ocin01_01561 [Orchesella cincta]|uniref:Uncharacterized protein n=1 Tax=Orchesella cincta TaxID=48709 RepID=A0A1D2NIH6_ORCCI|nr:hypothetical protein Ocin01_01561 [Orchesella cincta]
MSSAIGNKLLNAGKMGRQGTKDSSRMLAKLLLSLALVNQIIICTSEASIIHHVKENVVSQMNRAWTKLKAFDRDGKSQVEFLQEVGKNIEMIPQEIGKVEKEMLFYEYDEALKSLSKVKNTSVEWRDKWSEIAVLTSPVDVLYGHFKIFPEMPDAFVPGSGALAFDANSLTDLILKPLYSPDINKGTITLKFLVENAHFAAVSHIRAKDAFTLLKDHIEEALQQSYWCLWNAKTPQRVVYGLYTTLSLMDIKEYTLLNFAWMLRYAVNSTDPGNSVEESTISLENRLKEKAISAKAALEKTSSGYWRCDPIKYEKGKNYDEFQELLQGYIENEQYMHHTRSCKQTCSDYNFVKGHCPYPDPQSCLQQHVCTGNLVDCKFIAADATVCPGKSPRRFDYIQYKKGPTLGDTTGKCKQDTTRKDSFWRLFYHCSNCFCLCDDPDSLTTIRHVSLVPVTSDIASNRVVHLQIEEGVPTAEGLVIEETTKWKPVPRVDKHNKTQAIQLDYTQRAFDLDELLVPLHHVVTGVRFRVLGTHVNLEVRATQINPETGKLLEKTSHWISNDNTPESGNRHEMTLEDPDVPTKTHHPSVPDSHPDQYISFGASSQSKDVSQTTVPFIDIQEVRPKPAVWLKGIGIYHKGQQGFGGFIAPKIFTHSAANYIQIEEDYIYYDDHNQSP